MWDGRWKFDQNNYSEKDVNIKIQVNFCIILHKPTWISLRSINMHAKLIDSRYNRQQTSSQRRAKKHWTSLEECFKQTEVDEAVRGVINWPSYDNSFLRYCRNRENFAVGEQDRVRIREILFEFSISPKWVSQVEAEVRSWRNNILVDGERILEVPGAGCTKVLAVTVAKGERIHHDGCSAK